MFVQFLRSYVEPHGQSPWHLTNARVGRHPPPDVGTGRPKVGAFILSRLNRGGAFCCRGNHQSENDIHPRLGLKASQQISAALHCIEGGLSLPSL